MHAFLCLFLFPSSALQARKCVAAVRAASLLIIRPATMNDETTFGHTSRHVGSTTHTRASSKISRNSPTYYCTVASTSIARSVSAWVACTMVDHIQESNNRLSSDGIAQECQNVVKRDKSLTLICVGP
ncbi:hypothetical protein BCV70DRAFT_112909 [Testicularia cyperi]|uniref:Secreted protein n=1 Tax=Testicularia cyperi TaxID=1882483 RepID=A0A317XNC2_9BASI|nr:hypothetical protein BCV70DRAFT_112909 [Testicularia cyperi]